MGVYKMLKNILSCDSWTSGSYDTNAGFMEYMNYNEETNNFNRFTLKFWIKLDESLSVYAFLMRD